jgi:hypothetical protein
MTDNKKVSDTPLEIRAEEAMRKAVANVIADHKRTGDPIVIWRDGKVVKVPADQIEVREPEAEYGNSKLRGWTYPFTLTL